jgi:small-conductance mechanosensitive channel
MITVGNYPAFALWPQDIPHESGLSLEQLTEDAIARLRDALAARAEQRNVPLLLRGIGFTFVATLVLIAVLWLIRRVRATTLARLNASLESRRLKLFQIDVMPFAGAIPRSATKVSAIAAGIVAVYLWLTFVLVQFPYTAPWGRGLGRFLRGILVELGNGALSALPGLFTVLVIIVLTRITARSVSGLFRSVERGHIRLGWLEPETAKATRRLVIVVIWLFALTIAYPYIPGSQSDAFKGVSVFTGLMLSLGSAGMVNQVMSGLVVVYSRACKVGDYIKVGDTEGTVTLVGVLSTKIMTPRSEEITIPNAVLVGTSVTNYSRLAGEEGSVLWATVTIGYDTPWRQVHGLLELAASRTKGLRSTSPHVLQRSLSDFYVEYQVLVRLERAETRNQVLSDLHAQIQDAFNEFGVQIMSPNFRDQPADKIVVDPANWYQEPAKPAEKGPVSG